jgi:hypothetical protein
MLSVRRDGADVWITHYQGVRLMHSHSLLRLQNVHFRRWDALLPWYSKG